jgi:hypothetical protein
MKRIADNVEINPGLGGDEIAADDISGVKYPRSKITLGNDGQNDGDVSSSNPAAGVDTTWPSEKSAVCCFAVTIACLLAVKDLHIPKRYTLIPL